MIKGIKFASVPVTVEQGDAVGSRHRPCDRLSEVLAASSS